MRAIVAGLGLGLIFIGEGSPEEGAALNCKLELIRTYPRRKSETDVKFCVKIQIYNDYTVFDRSLIELLSRVFRVSV